MSPKKLTNFRIDSALLEGMEQIRARDADWTVSRQVREAIKDWLENNDAKVRTAPVAR
jgi:hypothetical protein